MKHWISGWVIQAGQVQPGVRSPRWRDWGLGGSFLTNIFDQFRLGNDEQPARRLMVLLVVAIPPFVLAYSGMVSFVNALYFAGVFSGVILSIMPIGPARGQIATLAGALEHQDRHNR